MVRPITAGLLVSLASAMPLAAHAATASSSPAVQDAGVQPPASDATWMTAPPDAWRFQATIYGWLPDLDGKTAFPAGAGSIGISGKTIIRHLDFTSMVSFEANKGRLGFLADYIYLNLGASRSNPGSVTAGGAVLPPGVGSHLHLDVKGSLGLLAMSYRMGTTPRATMDLVGGARLIYLKERLDWGFSGITATLPVPTGGTSEAKVDNWDAIIGLKGQVLLDPQGRWFMPYYVDVGTGDSNLTWQALVGLGYRFRWGSVTANWRYLDYQFQSGDAIRDLSLNGPALGVTFRW